MKKYNYLGEDITGIAPRLLHSSYGYINESGILIPLWTKENEFVDAYGFDKLNREENGYYLIDIVLPKDTLICRYGNHRGRFTTDIDSEYTQLGLPYDPRTIEYHVYKVISDVIEVSECIVTKGKVAKMFGSEGGAVQYMHHQSIARELADGKIKEVWL